MQLPTRSRRCGQAEGSRSVIRRHPRGWQEPKTSPSRARQIRDPVREERRARAGIEYIRLRQFQNRRVNDIEDGPRRNTTGQPSSSCSTCATIRAGSYLVRRRSRRISSSRQSSGSTRRAGAESEHALRRAASIPTLTSPSSFSSTRQTRRRPRSWPVRSQDWGALVCWTQASGKAPCKTIIPLSDGSGLRLNHAKYYTPKGALHPRKGISPDIWSRRPSPWRPRRRGGASAAGR